LAFQYGAVLATSGERSPAPIQVLPESTLYYITIFDITIIFKVAICCVVLRLVCATAWLAIVSKVRRVVTVLVIFTNRAVSRTKVTIGAIIRATIAIDLATVEVTIATDYVTIV
jgi:hypothetical protein